MSDNEEYTTDIPIEQLEKYPRHPFRTLSGHEFDELCASIRENGILNPITVRHTDKIDKSGNEVYEIISGHSRVEAAKQVQLFKVPAHIVNMSDDEADIKVVEFNYGRKNMTPCDLGKAFKLRLDALNRQGQRPLESTSGQDEQKSSRDEVASMFGISGSKVHRYMRLAHLIPKFQDAVDHKRMLLSAGENISYLRIPEQKILHQLFMKNNQVLTRHQSIALKKARQDSDRGNQTSNLTKEQIIEILESAEDKSPSAIKKPKKVQISYEAIEKYIEKHFEGRELSEEAIQEMILSALESYEANR